MLQRLIKQYLSFLQIQVFYQRARMLDKENQHKECQIPLVFYSLLSPWLYRQKEHRHNLHNRSFWLVRPIRKKKLILLLGFEMPF